jgi:drug/metabolite transporter (DMT)-like permease
MFTLLLSLLLFGNAGGRRALFAVPVMLAGVLLTMQVNLRDVQLGNTGDWLILGGAFFLACNAFLIKKIMDDVHGLQVAAVNCLVNVAVFAAVFVAVEPPGALAACPPAIWLALLLCGACCFLFFVGYYAALKVMPVWEVRLLCLAVPVVAALAGWIAFDTAPTATQAVGATLILGGAGTIILRGRRARQTARERNENETQCPVEVPERNVS